MPEEIDQTQNQQPGDGQDGQEPNGLEDQLASLNQQLNALQTRQDETESQRRRQQARADRLSASTRARQLSTPRRPPVQRQPAQLTQPTQQRSTQQAPSQPESVETERELVLLRSAVKHGLSQEEIDNTRDLPWKTEYELNLQMSILTTRKEVSRLQAQLDSTTEVIPPKVDDGGPTDPGADQLNQEIVDIRERAQDSLGKKRYQDATWLSLSAAHKDPSKRMLIRKP